MTQIVVDLAPDIAERLELRAKRLGSTMQREASRLLMERLESEPTRPSGALLESAPEDIEIDPRFIRHHGFLFVGEIAPDAIPDHRALQEERIDALVKDTGAGRI